MDKTTTTKTGQRVGYSISRVDHDEWSWSVEILRTGETVWGRGSDLVAGECAYSKSEAVDAIKATLATLGHTLESATQLPF